MSVCWHPQAKVTGITATQRRWKQTKTVSPYFSIMWPLKVNSGKIDSCLWLTISHLAKPILYSFHEAASSYSTEVSFRVICKIDTDFWSVVTCTELSQRKCTLSCCLLWFLRSRKSLTLCIKNQMDFHPSTFVKPGESENLVEGVRWGNDNMWAK